MAAAGTLIPPILMFPPGPDVTFCVAAANICWSVEGVDGVDGVAGGVAAGQQQGRSGVPGQPVAQQ